MDAGQVISTILKHDKKVTSYKLALLRAINDVVLAFPDLHRFRQDVAIPLRVLAEFWVAYYWPFVDAAQPIWQGQRAQSQNDLRFRPHLTRLREAWEQEIQAPARPADGFVLVNDLRISRKRDTYSPQFLDLYQQAIKEITRAIEYPIQYAGPGEWSVFDRPKLFKDLQGRTIAIPGTQPEDRCIVIRCELWEVFHSLSLWVEALCIHEWCLFSEAITQNTDRPVTRGDVYTLLTDRPDNRRPLTWERNQIDVLLMEGHSFICPWTRKPLTQPQMYHLDHIIPVAIYPVNELWNLVPSDPKFNCHKKKDYLPTDQCLKLAQGRLAHTYNIYSHSPILKPVLQQDVRLRFATLDDDRVSPEAISCAVVNWVAQVAECRNISRFDCY
ncbi:MAG: HNH endonuclease [Gloeomargarita sp. SKYG116]|nr:HNH endonuclease [Gloeomargarita sp. SKYG116]MDW8402067.1 HNH endonuclease signature motif containing protein [Gloeomargarita sp. SKYGB_i_bin116]